jgi:hypothetical protein
MPCRPRGAGWDDRNSQTRRLRVLNFLPHLLRGQRRRQLRDAELGERVHHSIRDAGRPGDRMQAARQSRDIAQHRLHHLALVRRKRSLRRHGIADIIALDRKPGLDAGGEVVAREGLIHAPERAL